MKGRRGLRILKGLGIGSGILVLGIVALAVVVWMEPGLVINQRFLPRILGYVPGVKITYDRLDGRASSVSFFRKRVELETSGLCVTGATTPFKSCAHQAKIVVEVSVGDGWQWTVRELEIDRGELVLSAAKAPGSVPPPAETPPSDTLVPTPPEFLKSIVIEQARVDVRRVAIDWDGGLLVGSVDVAVEGRKGHGRVRVDSDARLRIGTEAYEGKARVDLASLGSEWYGPYHGDFSVRASGGGRRAEMDGIVRAAGNLGDALGFRLSAVVQDGARRYRAQLDGTAGKDRLETLLAGRADGLLPEIPRVDVERCSLRLAFPVAGTRRAAAESGGTTEQAASIECRFQATTAFLSEVPGNRSRKFVRDILRRIPVSVAADARVADPLTGRVEGTVNASVADVVRGSKDGNLRVTSDFAGRLQDFPKDWKASASGLVELKSFRNLVRWLEGQPWAIPEPFASLDGPIEIKTAPEANLFAAEGSIPILLSTKLRSPQQSLVVNGEGTLRFKKAPEGGGPKASGSQDLGFRVSLDDVRFVLPRFGFHPPPPLFPDSRITRTVDAARILAREEKPAKSSFTYDVQVATSPGHPLLLITDLAQAPVPVTLDVHVKSDAPPQGFVRVGATPAKFFGHRAELKHLDLKLGRRSELTEVNGQVSVYYTDYTIHIYIVGLLKDPKIRYLSDPPLSEDQVLAVLIFGKKIEALDRDQAQSLGSLQSGIADGAVTLASMYLLASTPVESIGYDPATRVFTAKIRLADGTSLNIGTNLSRLNQLGVRHRLGPNWTISTYLSNPLDPITRSLTAFLEWSRGY